MEEVLPSDAEEKDLLDGDEEDDDNAQEMPEVLKNLTQVLTTMSASMMSMEKSVKRLHRGEPLDAGEPVKKRRKSSKEPGQNDDSDVSDGEGLLQSTAPQVDTTKEGEGSVSDARHEHQHDALLTEISQDFDQDEDIGPNINQQLAEIINKRWSAKLPEPKVKEKMEKYSRPANCDKLTVPRVNTEIWDKLDTKTRQHDLRASSIQKTMVKVGAILAQSTETLVQLRVKQLPEVDKLVKLNTDALAYWATQRVSYHYGVERP